MESEWLHILALIGIGGIGLVITIPYGLAFQIDPWVICITNIIGSSLSISIIYFLGKKVKRIIQTKRGRKLTEGSERKMNRILERYGVIGLGLIMPGFFGPAIGMAIGISLVRNLKKLFFWSIIGCILWSVGLITLVKFGFVVF